MGEISINTEPMIQKGLSVHGFPSGHSLDSGRFAFPLGGLWNETDILTEEAIEFAEVHGVKCMVETFPLQNAQQAFDRMLSGGVRFRSVLVME